MHYQKISKYKKNNDGNFSLVDYNELYWQTIPLLYSLINTKQNILLAYTKKITVGKERIKKKTKKYNDILLLQTKLATG
jgi:hypothetical protein